MMMITDKERREVAARLRGLDVSDLGDERGIIDTPEEAGALFARMLEAANDYRPGLHYAMSHYVAEDAVELFADLIDRPACRKGEHDQYFWRCTRCGAFVYWDAVTDLCGVIPERYCPSCGAEVVE